MSDFKATLYAKTKLKEIYVVKALDNIKDKIILSVSLNNGHLDQKGNVIMITSETKVARLRRALVVETMLADTEFKSRMSAGVGKLVMEELKKQGIPLDESTEGVDVNFSVKISKLEKVAA